MTNENKEDDMYVMRWYSGKLTVAIQRQLWKSQTLSWLSSPMLRRWSPRTCNKYTLRKWPKSVPTFSQRSKHNQHISENKLTAVIEKHSECVSVWLWNLWSI